MNIRACMPLLLLLLLLSTSFQSAAEEESLVKLPPQSLAQWYKPINKRQVWLHNMFKLRREMQAVSEYLEEGELSLAKKWGERLVTHYKKIGEMVPEWQEELSLEFIEQLEASLVSGDKEGATRALKKVGRSCRSCHRDFRAVTAALYRTPDFSGMTVKGQGGTEEREYSEVMKTLSALVNRVKIAAEDNRHQLAMESVNKLESELGLLGKSCISCHKEEAARERFLGKQTADVLQKLKQGIEEQDAKKIGRNLGTAAVITCARCHTVHRTLYDLRGVVMQ